GRRSWRPCPESPSEKRDCGQGQEPILVSECLSLSRTGHVRVPSGTMLLEPARSPERPRCKTGSAIRSEVPSNRPEDNPPPIPLGSPDRKHPECGRASSPRKDRQQMWVQ